MIKLKSHVFGKIIPENKLWPLCGAYEEAHCINLFLNVEGDCSPEGLVPPL